MYTLEYVVAFLSPVHITKANLSSQIKEFERKIIINLSK